MSTYNWGELTHLRFVGWTTKYYIVPTYPYHLISFHRLLKGNHHIFLRRSIVFYRVSLKPIHSFRQSWLIPIYNDPMYNHPISFHQNIIIPYSSHVYPYDPIYIIYFPPRIPMFSTMIFFGQPPRSRAPLTCSAAPEEWLDDGDFMGKRTVFAIENGHRNSWWSHETWWLLSSCPRWQVSLPEGIAVLVG